MIRKVDAIDDLVRVRNVIVYVSDFRNLDVLIEGLFKYCPDVNIYAPENNYPAIAGLMPSGKIHSNLFSFNQLVLEPDIRSTLVEPLQSKIFLGLLGKTYCLQHQKIIKDTKTVTIDLLVMNFGPIILPEGPNDFENALTRIDHAGQAILSSAVVNSPRVAVLGSPSQYKDFITELESRNGQTSFEFRLQAAAESAARAHTYSFEVAAFLNDVNVGEAKECYQVINPVANASGKLE